MPNLSALTKLIDRHDRARRIAAKHRAEPPSRADFLRKLAALWQQAGEEKYRDYSGRIVLSRLIEECKRDRNAAQAAHWLDEYARHDASSLADNAAENTAVSQHYRARVLLECGDQAAALAALHACHAADPTLIAKLVEPAVQTLWLQRGNPSAKEARQIRAILQRRQQAEQEAPAPVAETLALPAWRDFFRLPDDEAELPIVFFDEDGESSEDDGYEPTAEQRAAVQAFQRDQSAILHAFLAVLFARYPQWRAQWSDFYDADEMAEMMPDISDPDGFADLLSPTAVYIHPADGQGEIGIGVAFHCEWELEHGLGAVFRSGEVVEIDGADIAFCF